MKQPAFSVTKDQLVFTAYRGSGPGGQHRNKVSTAIRLEHPASGVVVTCESHKSQLQNKREALLKLGRHPKFRFWCKCELDRLEGKKTPEQIVDEMMQPNNILVEYRENGKWEAE